MCETIVSLKKGDRTCFEACWFPTEILPSIIRVKSPLLSSRYSDDATSRLRVFFSRLSLISLNLQRRKNGRSK